MSARFVIGLLGLALVGCEKAPAKGVIRQPIDVICTVEGVAMNETYKGLSGFMVEDGYVVFYFLDGHQLVRLQKDYGSCLAEPSREPSG